MLVGNAVQQPRADRFYLLAFLLGLARVPHALPLPELVPLLVVNEPAFKVCLVRFVVQQCLIGFCDLRFADWLPLKRRNAAIIRDRAHIKALSYGYITGCVAVEAVSGLYCPVTG